MSISLTFLHQFQEDGPGQPQSYHAYVGVTGTPVCGRNAVGQAPKFKILIKGFTSVILRKTVKM